MPSACAAPRAWAICPRTARATAQGKAPTRRSFAGERRAVEQLHDDVERARRLVLAGVDDEGNVIARNRRGQPRLTDEAGAEAGVAGELHVHHLQRAARAGGRLHHLVDEPHAAFGDRTHHLVGTADQRACA